MKYEIMLAGGEWIEVSEYIWRSWTGQRRFNGRVYTGPVYYLGSEKCFDDIAEDVL